MEQLRLARHCELVDLIEEHRSCARMTPAEVAILRPMTLPVKGLGSNCGAAHLEEGFIPAPGELVDLPGRNFLTCATLTHNQHGDVGRGDVRDNLLERQHGRADRVRKGNTIAGFKPSVDPGVGRNVARFRLHLSPQWAA